MPWGARFYQYGFPLFIVERSPLLIRDLDLLNDINRQSWVGVVISISSLDPALKRAFEPRSPGVKRRLQLMQKLSDAGIMVGTGLMPILPFVGDDKDHLEEVIIATKDHGGKFIMAGGLTMDGVQAERTLAAATSLDPALESRMRAMYRWEPGSNPQYGPPQTYNAKLGLLVRELCERHGLLDRMPRYISPGPLGVNKRIAERLFLRTYDLELQEAKHYQIFAYRKAAWTVDEHTESIMDAFIARGNSGLEELPGIGKSISKQISTWLNEEQTEYRSFPESR